MRGTGNGTFANKARVVRHDAMGATAQNDDSDTNQAYSGASDFAKRVVLAQDLLEEDE